MLVKGEKRARPPGKTLCIPETPCDSKIVDVLLTGLIGIVVIVLSPAYYAIRKREKCTVVVSRHKRATITVSRTPKTLEDLNLLIVIAPDIG